MVLTKQTRQGLRFICKLVTLKRPKLFSLLKYTSKKIKLIEA